MTLTAQSGVEINSTCAVFAESEIMGLLSKGQSKEKILLGVMNRKRKALRMFSRLRATDRPPISGLDAPVVYQSMFNDDQIRFTKN